MKLHNNIIDAFREDSRLKRTTNTLQATKEQGHLAAVFILCILQRLKHFSYKGSLDSIS